MKQLNYYYSEKRETLQALEAKGIRNAYQEATNAQLPVNTFLARKAYHKNRYSQVFYFKIYTGYQNTLKMVNKVLIENKIAIVTIADERKLLKIESFNSMEYYYLQDYFQTQLQTYIDQQKRLDSVRKFTWLIGGNPKRQLAIEQYHKQEYTEQLKTLCYYYDIPYTDYDQEQDALAFAERFNAPTYANEYDNNKDRYIERKEVYYHARKEKDASEIYTNRMTVLYYLMMNEPFYKPYNESIPPLPEIITIKLTPSIVRALNLSESLIGQTLDINTETLYPTDPLAEADGYGNTDIMDDLEFAY